MAPAPTASPPRSHLVRLFIRACLLAKRIEPRANGRQSAQCSIGVDGCVAGPLRRQCGFREHCFNRTLRHARVAIDTRLRIDHQHVIIEMKSLNRTDKRTVSVATVNARLGHDIRHLNFGSLKKGLKLPATNLNQKRCCDTTMKSLIMILVVLALGVGQEKVDLAGLSEKISSQIQAKLPDWKSMSPHTSGTLQSGIVVQA